MILGSLGALALILGSCCDGKTIRLRKRNGSNQGVIGLYEGTGAYYYGEMEMGTPDQHLLALFDLTSPDLFVIPEPRSNKPCFYNSSASITYTPTDRNETIVFEDTPYGVNYATGPVAKDILKVAGFKSVAQEFVLATTLVGLGVRPPCSFFGLGVPSFGPTSMRGPLMTLLMNGRLESSRFGLWIKTDSEEESFPEGELTLGFLNSNRYMGPLLQMPLFVTNQQWNVALTGFYIGSHSMGWSGAVRFQMRYNYNAMPKAAAAVLAGYLGATEILINHDGLRTTWVIPCASVPQLPTIAIGLAGFNLDLTPAQYVSPIENDPQNRCILEFMGEDDTMINSDLPTWTLGEPFFRAYYTAYDFVQNRVYVAPAVQETPTI